MKKTLIVGMAALFLAVGAVLSAKAEGKPCPMAKDGKAKTGCCMGMKDIKNCKFSDKPVGKDDKVCYVCPMKDSMSDKPGKCPKCGMELKKVYCQKSCGVGKDGMKGAGMECYKCEKCGEISKTGGKCPKCGAVMKKLDKKACPYMSGKGEWKTKVAGDRALKPEAVPTK
jgi:hypothetical protein